MARHDGPQINLLQDGLVVILSRGQLFLVSSYTSQTESGRMCVNKVIWSLAWVLVWDCTLQILPQNVYKEMQLEKTKKKFGL